MKSEERSIRRFKRLKLKTAVMTPDRTMAPELSSGGKFEVKLEESRNGVLASWGRFEFVIPWGNIRSAEVLSEEPSAQVLAARGMDAVGKNKER